MPLWALIMRAASRRLPALHAELAGTLALIAVGYVASAFVFYGSPAPPLTVLPPSLGALGAGGPCGDTGPCTAVVRSREIRTGFLARLRLFSSGRAANYGVMRRPSRRRADCIGF